MLFNILISSREIKEIAVPIIQVIIFISGKDIKGQLASHINLGTGLLLCSWYSITMICSAHGIALPLVVRYIEPISHFTEGKHRRASLGVGMQDSPGSVFSPKSFNISVRRLCVALELGVIDTLMTPSYTSLYASLAKLPDAAVSILWVLSGYCG